MRRHLIVAGLATVLVACQTTAPPPATAPTAEVSLAVRWVRSSAEYRGIVLQTYRTATRRVRELAPGHTPNTWGVVLDADETIISNVEYQLERDRAGLGYSPESWAAWTRRRAAPPLPGAIPFLDEVHRLGGRVVVVTNRSAAECDDTRADLRAFGVPFDAVLCRPADGGGDKNPRFAAVARGDASPGLPPLQVLMFLGDNIRDFPHLDQSARTSPDTALAPFGDTWFLLPNPMYGSWVDNPLD